MKPTRFLIVAIILLGMVATASALTPSGTSITNQATGTYKDANNNDMTGVSSNVVTTVVSQVAGVSLGSNQAQAMSALSSTTYPITLTNMGNGTDFFTIGATGASDMTGSYSIEIFHDADGDQILDEDEDDAEITQTTNLTYNSSATDAYNLIVRVTDTKVGGSPSGETHVVTLTGTSDFATDSTHTITLTTTLQAASVNGETEIIGDNTPGPGDPIVFETCFENDGTAVAYDLVFVTQMPSNTTLNTSSVSLDGGNTYITIPSTGASYDTGTRTLTLDLGDLGYEDPNNTICVRYTVIVDEDLEEGLPIEFPDDNPELTYDNEDGPGGTEYPPEHPEEDDLTFPSGGIVVEQVYAVELTGPTSPADEFSGDPSDSLFYAFTITNNGNGTDNFDLSHDSTYVTWEFYPDLDGDGVLDPADIAAGPITSTGDIEDGVTEEFIAVGIIPAGTADGATDSSTFTATSQGDGSAADSDDSSTTCTAPILSLVKSVTPGGNQPPGTILTYQVIVTNSGTGVANTVVISDQIPENTTYVAESMEIDGDDTITDASDTDAGTKAASSVVFEFDTMSATGGATDSHTLKFQVTID